MGLSFSNMSSFLSANKKIQIQMLMVGLDHAGKTTILYKLKLGEILQTIPTTGFNVETIEYKKIRFTIWDVGNGDKFWPLWFQYYGHSKGVIFVVDSTDRDRIIEAGQNLNYLLNREQLKDAILLVFANKQDLPNSMSTAEIADKLRLYELGNRKWNVQVASAVQGNGLYEGLAWISNVSTMY